MEEAKKIICYKRLMYKQFVQVWGLCGPQFLSYLPKRLTHLCRALYGDAILVYRFGAPIWPPEINQNIWSSLFLEKLFLFTRELLAYVHINPSSNTWNGYAAENQEERLFFQRDSIPILVSRTVKSRKFKLLYFLCLSFVKRWKNRIFMSTNQSSWQDFEQILRHQYGIFVLEA